jgi:hypothetical protein
MLVILGTGQPWDASQPIGDVRYPLNIEALWTDAELAEIGLARPSPPPPPPPEGE